MTDFTKAGYQVTRNFVPNYDYYFTKCMKSKNNKKQWADKKGDNQARGTPNFYKLPILVKLHKILLPKMQVLTGLSLFTTYTYMRIYQKGNTLYQHTDRPACEVSCTVNLGTISDSIWPIHLADYEDNEIKVLLKPGDALLYRGCDLLHWRYKFKGQQQIQAFFHYVDQNGPNAWCKDDANRQQTSTDPAITAR